MEENWKNIKGYDGFYRISNFGRVMSFKSDLRGNILKSTNKTGWYLSVALISNSGKRSTARIHRLVAEHFIDNPLNLAEVNHKDLNKQNNHVSNLEWVDRDANHHHVLTNKPSMLDGMINHNRFFRHKKIRQISLDGKLIKLHQNGAEASQFSGVCKRNILQVANMEEYKPGKVRKQAGGFIWKFEEEMI